jgi:hypothetical protein
MPKKQVPETGERSIKKVILFCVVVVLLILISLLVRLSIVLKDSKYNGSDRFTIAIVDKKVLTFLSFDPATTSISSLRVTGMVLQAPPQRIIGIPVDGILLVAKPFTLSTDPSEAIQTILLHPTYTTKKDINGVDIFRAYLFAKSVSLKNIQHETLSMTKSENDIDKLAAQLFSDTKIVDDNLSIEIVNGTDISGMAKRLERLIDNAGGNVVAVSSTHEVEKKSKIYYYQKPSYTEERLQRMLGYPAVLSNTQGIADIKVVIGEDQVRTQKF